MRLFRIVALTFFIFIFLLFSTAIRSWSPPILQEVYDIILGSVLDFSSTEKRSPTKRRPLIPSNKLHPDVYSYIERNELYFYSPEAKKKRMYRFFYSLSALVVAVTAIGAGAIFLSRKKV
jgi:hypothetical protein